VSKYRYKITVDPSIRHGSKCLIQTRWARWWLPVWLPTGTTIERVYRDTEDEAIAYALDKIEELAREASE
jgi:uncharacterized protein (DUF433 family)